MRPEVKYGSLAIAVLLLIVVIILSYPSEQNDNVQIPIVQADLRPVKAIPEDQQGMEIPFQDNTFYASLGDEERQPEEKETVRNLFDDKEEDVIGALISKEDALEEAIASSSPYEGSVVNASDVQKDAVAEVIEANADNEESELLQKIEKPKAQPVESEGKIDEHAKSAKAELLQKIKPKEVREFEGKVASAAIAKKPKLHAAATSPDTIEFVRSVLNSEDDESVANVEPAAGVATVDPVGSAQYFVQLASITDRGRASSEYSKLQARFMVLSDLPYRVQEASLPSGTFYRIQTGPFTKERANQICDKIKAQKSGGCLVVR